MAIDYKIYHSGGGKFGFDALTGIGTEFALFRNMVWGVLVEKSTTGSSQLTGTGNGTFLYNLTHGIIVLNGKMLEVAAAADQACEAAGDILDDGQSRVYLIIAYQAHDGTITIKSVPGTVALSAAAVPPTPAEIEATIPVGHSWLAIGSMTIARTGATTVTEAVDNLYRPLLVPKSVHDA